MKKVIPILISLSLIVTMTACSVNDVTFESESISVNEKITTNPPIKEISDDDIVPIYSSSDVIATDINDICKLSDVIIRVRYGKDIDTYAREGSGTPVTIAEFEVIDVIKGEYNGSTIKAEFYGGIIPMSEYLQALSEATLQKAGYDNYTEEEIKKKFVKLVDTTPLSEFSSSDEYLLLLSYDPETDVYFVLCGGYGSPVVKDNKVYNSVKDEYVDMARIEAAAQTELEFAIK
ncbi:MAG: hypothetical protein IJA55_08920 [Clostridia bacterium]|nr:hypothetical protein [Clostridia bacterium]